MNPAAGLPLGGILVVGIAQSGAQIAENLVRSGKKIFLSTGNLGRVPGRYRGKDIFEWLEITGFFDVRTETITAPDMFKMRQPLVSGVGERGHTVSLQSLARSGVTIFSKTKNADSDTIFLQSDAAVHVRFGDGFSLKTKKSIDDYILHHQITIPFPEEDIDE